jgi:hypothetical protein
LSFAGGEKGFWKVENKKKNLLKKLSFGIIMEKVGKKAENS